MDKDKVTKKCDSCGKDMVMECPCDECMNELTFCSQRCAINFVQSALAGYMDEKGKVKVQ